MAASLYGTAEARKTIWVFLEQEGGSLESVSLELLAKGRQMADDAGWPLTGLLLGNNLSHLETTPVAHGADQVLVADHPLLEYFTIDAYTHVTFQALMDHKPGVFLLGATPNGRDLAGRLAVRLRTGLNADCTGLRLSPETGVLESEVSGFGGGVLALIEMQSHRPQMATVRPGVFPPGKPDYHRKGELVKLDVPLDKAMIRTRLIERVIGEGVDLTQAPVLVAGGRGIEGDFDLMRKLAGILDGDVGATRPPVDEGYIERERQIGQTGVICRPRLAICCGISGAFHFIVGIQDAGVVIAINSDPDAPIFEHADYCVVADVAELVPALIKELQQLGEVSYA